ncbi:MAG: AAA family ATPase [Planctomycetota bacterium]
MYESFFALHRRPFATTADPTCYVPDAAAEATVAAIADAVRGGRGVVTVTGPDGVGKTMLSRRVGLALAEEATVARVLGGGHPSRRSLLQSMLYEIGHPHTTAGEADLRHELHAAVTAAAEEGRKLVFVVDDAHHLNDRLFAELARFASHAAPDDSATLVLVGGPALEEQLADPANRDLQRRVGMQLAAEPLGRDDAVAYTRARFRAAGGHPDDAFAADALDAVAEISGGVPRAINQLADHTLLLAFVAERPQVTRDLVLDALDDLRRLPTRWNEPAGSTVLEYETAASTHAAADDDWGTVFEVGSDTPPAAEIADVESTDDETHIEDLDSLPAAKVTVLDEPADDDAYDPAVEHGAELEDEPSAYGSADLPRTLEEEMTPAEDPVPVETATAAADITDHQDLADEFDDGDIVSEDDHAPAIPHDPPAIALEADTEFEAVDEPAEDLLEEAEAATPDAIEEVNPDTVTITTADEPGPTSAEISVTQEPAAVDETEAAEELTALEEDSDPADAEPTAEVDEPAVTDEHVADSADPTLATSAPESETLVAAPEPADEEIVFGNEAETLPTPEPVSAELDEDPIAEPVAEEIPEPVSLSDADADAEETPAADLDDIIDEHAFANAQLTADETVTESLVDDVSHDPHAIDEEPLAVEADEALAAAEEAVAEHDLAIEDEPVGEAEPLAVEDGELLAEDGPVAPPKTDLFIDDEPDETPGTDLAEAKTDAEEILPVSFEPAAFADPGPLFEEPVEDRYAKLDALAATGPKIEKAEKQPDVEDDLDRLETLVADGLEEEATVAFAEPAPAEDAIGLFTRWRRLRRGA